MIEAILSDVKTALPSAEFPPSSTTRWSRPLSPSPKHVGEQRVVLTGGCFQNRYLTERAVRRLQAEGFQPYWHQRVPPNDGGIALGQVVAALAQLSGIVDRKARMCLAIPGKIESVSGDDPLTRMGKINFGGILKEASLAYVPEARVGDYVIVHVGFALSRLDEDEAQKVFEYLKQMEELGEIEEHRGGVPPVQSG